MKPCSGQDGWPSAPHGCALGACAAATVGAGVLVLGGVPVLAAGFALAVDPAA
jgi:hypothetical protein